MQSTIQGGSFLDALKTSGVSNLSAALAFKIGDVKGDISQALGDSGGAFASAVAHGVLGCASAAALGNGCMGGAIGGATSALISPWMFDVIGGDQGVALRPEQIALLVGIASLTGGLTAGALGQDGNAGAVAAQNEAANNTGMHSGSKGDMLSKVCSASNEACSEQTARTLIDARLKSSQAVVDQMNAAAPYVAGALGISLLGPEAVMAALTAGAYDYLGDSYSHWAGLSTDKPSFTKSYVVSAFSGVGSPFLIADRAINGMGKVGKMWPTSYNSVVSGTTAFGAAAATHQDSPDIAAGFGAGSTAFGSAVKQMFPGSLGEFLNQVIQGAAGPLQSAITQGGGK